MPRAFLIHATQSAVFFISRWEIAEAVGVSEDYLNRVFHKVTGMSPQAFREKR